MFLGTTLTPMRAIALLVIAGCFCGCAHVSRPDQSSTRSTPASTVSASRQDAWLAEAQRRGVERMQALRGTEVADQAVRERPSL